MRRGPDMAAKTKPAAQGPPLKKYPTLGVCGLDCGLCPRYYTQGKSRCPGCAGPGFFDKHPSCSFITCCVKKKNLEVCAECPDFPCPKFKPADAYQHMEESPSYPSYKVVTRNLSFIKEHGTREFIAGQKKRIKLLEKMLVNFDDGRSQSLFCRAACLYDPSSLANSLAQASQRVKKDHIEPDNARAKAAILKEMLLQIAPPSP